MAGVSLTSKSGGGKGTYDPIKDLYIPNARDCLVNWRRAVARARQDGTGARAARIHSAGDSTTYGTISGTNPGGVGPNAGAWPARLQTLAARSGRLRIGPSFQLSGGPTGDPRITAGAGWAGLPYQAAAGAGGTLTFADDTPGVVAYDIYYSRHAGTPTTIPLNIDGAGASNQDVSGLTTSFQTKRVRVSGLGAGTHTLVWSAPAVGTVGIVAIEPITATPPDIKHWAWGSSGRAMAGLMNNGSIGWTNPATGQQSSYFICAGPPDLCHVHLGINDMAAVTDAANRAADVATYKANMHLFCDMAEYMGADAMITTFPDYLYAFNGVADEGIYESKPYYDAIYSVAKARGAVVIDLQNRWGYGTNAGDTGTAAVTPVTQDAMYDGVHPTLTGYWDIAAHFLDVLEAIS